MAVKPQLIKFVTDIIGITNVMTAFIFFGLLFIVLILIHYSVSLSKLTTEMKDIAQQVAILDGEQDKINQNMRDETPDEIPDTVRDSLDNQENLAQTFVAGKSDAGN
jgi:hypothetical protein